MSSQRFISVVKVCSARELLAAQCVEDGNSLMQRMEVDMGFGRGVLFWLLGVPIPIIILLALFWHH
jgi:hypothetical protein